MENELPTPGPSNGCQFSTLRDGEWTPWNRTFKAAGFEGAGMSIYDLFKSRMRFQSYHSDHELKVVSQTHRRGGKLLPLWDYSKSQIFGRFLGKEAAKITAVSPQASQQPWHLSGYPGKISPCSFCWWSLKPLLNLEFGTPKRGFFAWKTQKMVPVFYFGGPSFFRWVAWVQNFGEEQKLQESLPHKIHRPFRDFWPDMLASIRACCSAAVREENSAGISPDLRGCCNGRHEKDPGVWIWRSPKP